MKDKDIKRELDDIFKDPLLNITDEEKNLFDLPEALKKKQKHADTDYVAQKNTCENFQDYKLAFKMVHKDLHEGKRNLIKYKGDLSLKEGHYYVVSGILAYLDKIYNLKKEKRTGGHFDGRTRIIYENGTESDIKFRTLGKNIQNDGFIVTDNIDTDELAIKNSFTINNDDIYDGYIYVLQSLSTNPEIKDQQDLYKIGFSTIPVEERIRNCEYEPTYLMDNVRIVAIWKTFNMKTHVFENLVHQFFKSVQFHIKIKDLTGKEIDPHEWFVVPIGIIEKVVNRIIDGTIIDYKYNPMLGVLEKLENDNKAKSKHIDTKGLAILSLRIKQVYFDKILNNEKTIEYRDLKQSQLPKYTWVEQETGKRYLKKFDALKLYVGSHSKDNAMLIEITDTKYNSATSKVEFYLGKILEINIPKNE